jgi:pimeloyl-ACP methyl ester carboxylesterase
MNTHLRSATDNERSETLLVFLPGAYLKPEEFEQHGFISAVRERHLAADAMLVDADVSYYYDQTLSDRLQADVIEPQRARGYTSIWLVGISIGGFGALIHELARPGSVDGIVALAPYLGRRVLGAEIQKAGGLRTWHAPTGPQPDEEPDRKLWPFFQQYLRPSPREPAAAVPGLRPGRPLCRQPQAAGRRLAPGPRLHDRRRARLAAVAPALAHMLDVLPLPLQGRPRQSPSQPVTQSQAAAAPRPPAKPWAIAA